MKRRAQTKIRVQQSLQIICYLQIFRYFFGYLDLDQGSAEVPFNGLNAISSVQHPCVVGLRVALVSGSLVTCQVWAEGHGLTEPRPLTPVFLCLLCKHPGKPKGLHGMRHQGFSATPQARGQISNLQKSFTVFWTIWWCSGSQCHFTERKLWV